MIQGGPDTVSHSSIGVFVWGYILWTTLYNVFFMCVEVLHMIAWYHCPCLTQVFPGLVLVREVSCSTSPDNTQPRSWDTCPPHTCPAHVTVEWGHVTVVCCQGTTPAPQLGAAEAAAPVLQTVWPAGAARRRTPPRPVTRVTRVITMINTTVRQPLLTLDTA